MAFIFLFLLWPKGPVLFIDLESFSPGCKGIFTSASDFISLIEESSAVHTGDLRFVRRSLFRNNINWYSEAYSI